MKTSARNHWSGRVLSTQLGAVNAEIRVSLQGGAEIVASITLDSARKLGLEAGKEVVVLVKATMVLLIVDLEGYELSARNQLQGIVMKVIEGPVTADLTLELESGDHLTSTITRSSLETLGLSPGMKVTAAFKASAVFLGVKI